MDSANRFADRFDIPNRHASYEALVADPDVDVVYVATPHPMHHPNTLLALQAGKPALVEKAFTMTAAEAEDLVATARAEGLFLMEAMWTRFFPISQRSAACSPKELLATSSRSSPTMGNGSRKTPSFDSLPRSSEGARCWTWASIRSRSPRWSWVSQTGS